MLISANWAFNCFESSKHNFFTVLHGTHYCLKICNKIFCGKCHLRQVQTIDSVFSQLIVVNILILIHLIFFFLRSLKEIIS